jgi:hypothetical protein
MASHFLICLIYRLPPPLCLYPLWFAPKEAPAMKMNFEVECTPEEARRFLVCLM